MSRDDWSTAFVLGIATAGIVVTWVLQASLGGHRQTLLQALGLS